MAPGTVWSHEEDHRLRELVREYGEKKWSHISSVIGTKTSKQCRRRWLNHLNMEPKKGGWCADEDRLLLEYHSQMGNKWTEIAKMIGGRTDNAVKNRYHALARRDGKSSSDGSMYEDGSHFLDQEKIAKLHQQAPASKRNLDQNSSLERVREMFRTKEKDLEQARLNALNAVTSSEGMGPRARLDLRVQIPEEQNWTPLDSSILLPVSVPEMSGVDDMGRQVRVVHETSGEGSVRASLSADLEDEIMIESDIQTDPDVSNHYFLGPLKSDSQAVSTSTTMLQSTSCQRSSKNQQGMSPFYHSGPYSQVPSASQGDSSETGPCPSPSWDGSDRMISSPHSDLLLRHVKDERGRPAVILPAGLLQSTSSCPSPGVLPSPHLQKVDIDLYRVLSPGAGNYPMDPGVYTLDTPVELRRLSLPDEYNSTS